MALVFNGSVNTIDGLSTGGLNDDSIAIADLSATGTASASTYLCGNNTWATPAGYTGVATLKAWADFDGDGDVNATLTGGNITSITDHSTGQYTITFDTDFADINYMMCGSHNTQGFVGYNGESDVLVGSCKIGTLTDGGGYHDSYKVSVGFWR